jgi:hypothetical protein
MNRSLRLDSAVQFALNLAAGLTIYRVYRSFYGGSNLTAFIGVAVTMLALGLSISYLCRLWAMRTGSLPPGERATLRGPFLRRRLVGGAMIILAVGFTLLGLHLLGQGIPILDLTSFWASIVVVLLFIFCG